MRCHALILRCTPTAELENALERAAVLATGARIDVADLPQEIAGAVASAHRPGDKRTLADVERDYILAVPLRLLHPAP